jgi:hypothetical protein
MTIHAPSGSRSMKLDVWENVALGRITLQWAGDSSDTTVVRHNVRTIVVDGAVAGIDDFGDDPASLWGDLHAEYGVTEASVSAAIAQGKVVAGEPKASTVRAR